MAWFRGLFASPSVAVRIGATCVAGLVWFIVCSIVGYFALPQGMLRRPDPVTVTPSASQVATGVFFFNMISVILIVFAGLFAKRCCPESPYLSLGYLVLLVQFTLNGLTLGTWSFSSAPAGAAPDLIHRLAGMANVARASGLWEMAGQSIIAASLALRSRVLYGSGKPTIQPWTSVRPTRREAVLFVLGIMFIGVGALIEGAVITG